MKCDIYEVSCVYCQVLPRASLMKKNMKAFFRLKKYVWNCRIFQSRAFRSIEQTRRERKEVKLNHLCYRNMIFPSPRPPILQKIEI